MLSNTHAPAKEHGHGVTTGVGRNALKNLNGVVCQEVVEDQIAIVAKHVLLVVPVAVEAENVTVVIDELLQRVLLLVRSKWLHRFVKLNRNK